MRIVDANVLLYASDLDLGDHHAVSRSWLSQALNGIETIGLPWHSLLGFVRISTTESVSAHPLDPATALGLVERWLASPVVVTPEPDLRHGERLRALLGAVGRGGKAVPDAHLAALAIQCNATLVSFDSDFERFPGLRWEMPT